MKRGLLYLVFGEEYDELAAYTICYSQQFTDLPICVLTNLERRHSKWEDTKNINFVYISLPRKDNRGIKTSLNKYSPFDLSLYLDCDSVIQKGGIEEIFDLLENSDLLLHEYQHFNIGDKIWQLYKEVMLRLNAQLPISVYNSAFVGFRKNDRVAKFFALWNKYWKIGGSGRDMPALACAVKNSDTRVKKIIRRSNKIWNDERDNQVTIQHYYGPDFHTAFGIPKFKKWKPFDVGKEEQWGEVLFE